MSNKRNKSTRKKRAKNIKHNRRILWNKQKTGPEWKNNSKGERVYL